MIEDISISGLGVIGEARLPLGPGFTALTGETGAGKTMVVTALGLLLGARAESGVVRNGARSAVVEGRWIVPGEGLVADRVRDAGGDLDDGELILSRSVSADGRSRAVVGGRSTPIGVLGELGEQLVVVHGQSDQIRLRSSTAQREALDRFAGTELAGPLGDFREAFARWQDNQSQLEILESDRDARAREASELRLAIDEIEAIAPQTNEDIELAERAERLTNLEDLRIAAAGAHELVSSETITDSPDALGMVTAATRLLERAAEHDTALTPIVDTALEAGALLADLVGQLSSYVGGLDEDGSRELESVQARRAELSGIIRRHGTTLDDVIALLDEGSARLLELDGDDSRIEELRLQAGADRERVVELAGVVSGIRRHHAERLAELVSAEFAALAMPDARLIVEVRDRSEYGLTGKDEVSILLAPHAGAEPRPLGRGASGGELSRVMLAIEVVIAASDPVPTFVFDEVDAGVGGASATEIGRRLARLAQSAQVIVVTHLAQVAAFAENHLTVVKDSDGAVTASSVRQLDEEERIHELARMLSGLSESDTGLAHARELVSAAQGKARVS